MMKKLTTLFLFLFLTQTLHAAQYQIEQLKADLPQGHFEATVYRPIKDKIKAILILTPTIAGVSIIEKANAQYFSKDGFLVIMPISYDNEVESEEPNIAVLDASFLYPAIAAENFITMAEKKFNLKENLPVFALGASQGGIRTVIIASHSPRITAAWFATAGGDFASIYAYSKVKKIAAFRQRHMKFLGLTDVKEYETFLRAHLTNDPVIACQSIKAPFVQVMALRDDKVPTANQQLLADKCPEHKVIRINTGHIGGSLSTVNWRKKIKTFFLDSLK